MKLIGSNAPLDGISIISVGVDIEGNISANSDIRIDGKVKGNVASTGNIILGDKGVIIGDIRGKSVTIAGQVQGTVHSDSKIMLEATSALKGDIISKILVVQEGARFEGKSEVTKGSENVKPK